MPPVNQGMGSIPKIFEIVDRVALIHEGVVLIEGTPEEFISSTEPMVKAFLGEPMEEAGGESG